MSYPHFKYSGRRHRRHRRHFRRRWSGGPWSQWPQQSPDDDDSGDSGDSDDSQDSEVAVPAGCLEDRCTSDYVAWMQQSLLQLGARLKVTRVLDRNTINAINQFKARHGVAMREYYASPVLEQALLRAGASPAPPVRRLACGPTDVKTVLAPLLNRYRGDIPIEYLLGWITVESGGKLGDLTKICERGFFQVHPEESQDLKLDHDRLSTDPAYSVEGGIKLVRLYAAGVQRLADQYHIDKSGDLFWGLVKLRHWIPSAPARILLRMSNAGARITSWNDVKQFVQTNPNLGFGGFDPRAGVRSVDNYLNAAARWRKWKGN